MALAYDATRVTRDDAQFVPHGIVLDGARQAASDPGRPPWWLIEQATAYIALPSRGLRDLAVAVGVVVDHPCRRPDGFAIAAVRADIADTDVVLVILRRAGGACCSAPARGAVVRGPRSFPVCAEEVADDAAVAGHQDQIASAWVGGGVTVSGMEPGRGRTGRRRTRGIAGLRPG
jgi:hypothetical protein